MPSEKFPLLPAVAMFGGLGLAMYLVFRDKDITPNAAGQYLLKPGKQYVFSLGIAPPVPKEERIAFKQTITKDSLAGFTDDTGSVFELRITAPSLDLAGQAITEFQFDPTAFQNIGGRVVRVIRVREF